MIRQTIACGVVALLAGAAHADVLLEDDFDDNTLDATKWWVNTSGIPQNPKSAVEQNERMELQGRAHLNTVQQFDPADYPAGIEITGLWTFVSGDDMFQVLTRSDGQPAGKWGETNFGIEFYAYGANESFTIRSRGSAGVTGVSATKSSGFDISAGDTFAFTIFDDGLHLAFAFREVGDVSSWALATAQSSVDAATDYIVFHNRESGRRSNLDDVRIEAVPEPTSMTLGLLGLGLVAWRRRKRSEAG